MTTCNNCDCGVKTMKFCNNFIKINRYSLCIELISSVSLLGLFYYKVNFNPKKNIYLINLIIYFYIFIYCVT